MTRALLFLSAAAWLLGAGPASAQVTSRIRASGFYERYTFDSGPRISELTVPVGVDVSVGRYLDVTLSTGFVALDLRGDDPAFEEKLSGALDTELRLGVNLIPGRLIAIVNGAVPTGIKSVDSGDVAILVALSSDVIGFAVPTVGSGGTVGGGLVGALPLGKFALGLGATYSYPLSYQPLVGSADEVKPGSEVRARAGIEGPLARQTYLRVAGVFAWRDKDELGGVTQPGVGSRLIGYVELGQGFGNTQLTVYGFDVYRGGPRTEGTGVGLAVLPKGNLLAGGFRVSIPVSQSFSVAPRAEYRYATAAPDTASALEKSGSSFRVGLDLRQVITPKVSLALAGSGVFGDVMQGTTAVDFSGFRAGLVLEVRP